MGVGEIAARLNVKFWDLVVLASNPHLAKSFIYTEIKSRRGGGRFAGRVKYSRVLVCASVLRALPPVAPLVLESPPQRYSNRLKLAEGTSPRGLTYHCTDKIRHFLGELQQARGRSKITAPAYTQRALHGAQGSLCSF
jgi:hypothetical protein